MYLKDVSKQGDIWNLANDNTLFQENPAKTEEITTMIYCAI
jgi:hypothetical protein